jgi:hypothetical protein
LAFAFSFGVCVLVGAEFGSSVSLSGDTLAVGAPGESDHSIASGGAYVFTRSGATWTQQARLTASNIGFQDSFGISLSLSGDTLAVGAWLEDSSATGVDGSQANNSAQDSGAVYVFTRSGGTWTQQAYLKASNTGAGDNFGFSVSLSGDTLAVGAANENSSATGVDGNQADNSAQDSGAVYVFTRSGTTWAQRAYLKASNTGELNEFGASVSVNGNTLAVGAYLEGGYSGAVYVYEPLLDSGGR